MKRNFFIAVFVFIACLVIAAVIVVILAVPEKEEEPQVCFRDNCFKVEVASTPEQRMIGLMGRKSLEKDKGVLFVFERAGRYPFWMKNTLIPLDIIWLNSDGEVVSIKENAQPCDLDECPIIESEKEADYVLELNGGIAAEIGLIVGEKMDIKQ